MENKKFEFYGVDFKTELLLGIVAGVVLILIWAGLIFFYYQYNHLDSIIRVPKRIFFGSMFLGMGVCFFVLKIMGRSYKRKWSIILNRKHIDICYGKKRQEISLADITKMTLNGGAEMRYLTFIALPGKIKIRVGTNSLTPFSSIEDIKTVDELWHELEKTLPGKFENKKLNLSLVPEGTISSSYTKK